MEKELYHAGIKGMKWGRRRYQNPDGTLTPEGKKRYGNVHEDYAKAHSNKSVKEMSDAELRSRNNRLQMERQYADLTKKKGIGKKAITAFVSTAATISAVAGAAATYKKFGTAALDKIGNHVLNGIKIGRLD